MKTLSLICCLFVVTLLNAQESYEVLYLKGNYEQIKKKSSSLLSAEDYFWYANVQCKEGAVQ